MVARREHASVPSSPPILTIGYGNRSFEDFLALLYRHEVEVLVDVRSAPYSRARAAYRKELLRAALEPHGFEYHWLGRELGGRPEDPALYEDDRLVPERVRARPTYQQALRALLVERQAGRRLCLMCSELDPARCHRRSLLAPSLLEMGAEVAHVAAHGRLVKHVVSAPSQPRQPLLFETT